MKLSSSNIKKFLQKKAFLIFLETETPTKFFIFQEIELSYILRNGNPQKPFLFQEIELSELKKNNNNNNNNNNNKKLGKWNFLVLGLKNFLYSWRNFQNPKNQNLLYFSKKVMQ